MDLLRIGGTNTVNSGAVDYFRLWYVNCPRKLQLSCGNVNSRAFSWSGNYSARPGGWEHVVVTVDNLHGIMRVFRDGEQESVHTGFSVDLAPGALYLNVTKPNGTTVTGPYVDDLRIYDTALTPDEVRTLGRSLEKGTVGPVLPATSPVTVAAGACLRAEGAQHDVKSVAGAGEVNIRGRLLVNDWSDFAGTVSGQGQLVLAQNGGIVPLAASSVTANVAFDEDVVALSAVQVTTPRVRTTGHGHAEARGRERAPRQLVRQDLQDCGVRVRQRPHEHGRLDVRSRRGGERTGRDVLHAGRKPLSQDSGRRHGPDRSVRV